MTVRQLSFIGAIVVLTHYVALAEAAEPAAPPQKSATEKSAPAPSPVPPGKPLSASLGIAVYPTKQQDAAKQSQDEFECYNWAKESSSYDPINPPQQQPVVAETPKGGRVRGAVRGAAAGAAIGEVASNDADKGAGVGAVAGTLHGGQQQRRAQQAAQEKAAAQTGETKQKQLDGFKKGFSACLQGRGYSAVM